MTELDNVKQGDKVLTLVKAQYGFKEKGYKIPLTVDRTTKTQIIIGDKRYHKHNGRQVGASVNVPKIFPYSEDLDESRLYRLEMARLDKLREFEAKAEFVLRSDRYGMTDEALTTSIKLLSKLLELTKEQE